MGLISDILGTFADAADEIASIANDKDCDWYCDECGAYMNDQPGFTTEDDEWECTECGYLNDVSEDNIIENDPLEDADPEQYQLSVELCAMWQEMDEEEYEEKYNSLDQPYKDMVDDSIAEQTDY